MSVHGHSGHSIHNSPQYFFIIISTQNFSVVILKHSDINPQHAQSSCWIVCTLLYNQLNHCRIATLSSSSDTSALFSPAALHSGSWLSSLMNACLVTCYQTGIHQSYAFLHLTLCLVTCYQTGIHQSYCVGQTVSKPRHPSLPSLPLLPSWTDRSHAKHNIFDGISQKQGDKDPWSTLHAHFALFQ